MGARSAALLVLGAACAHFRSDPDAARVGIAHWLFVRNAYSDTAYVTVIAEDGQTRALVVAPRDSLCTVMPFADQTVRFRVRVGLTVGENARRIQGPGETWLLAGDPTPVTTLRCYQDPR